MSVSHCGQVAIYVKKYCKASEELWKIKYCTMQKYNFLNIHYYFYNFFLMWKKIIFEIFNIFENNIVSVELA